MSLTERALTLLDQAPAGAERTSLEITLATLRGVSAFHLLGAGDEARSALQRASSLLADVPPHPMRGLLLHGLGFLLTLRGEFADALATADRADALASGRMMRFFRSPRAQCVDKCICTRADRAARESLERALPAIERPTQLSSKASSVSSPTHRSLCWRCSACRSRTLALSGRRVSACSRRTRELARLGQPMALLVTIWYDALCEVRFGDGDRVATLADEMRALVDEFALAQGKSACRWFRGVGGRP